MNEIAFDEFSLTFDETADGFKVRAECRGSVATGTFELPLDEDFTRSIGNRFGLPRSTFKRDDTVSEESPNEAAKILGGHLFDAVFRNDVGMLFKSRLDSARERNRGLRIRFRLGDAQKLANVPWEYLFERRLNRFFGLSVDTPIVRSLDLPVISKPLRVKLPLNILVMISNPIDHPQLDVEGEWTRLKESLKRLVAKKLITLERLESATLSALQRKLREKDFHVLHYVGHSDFDKQRENGVLLLEDEHGKGHLVSGEKLGSILHDEKTLRLVILNSCMGAAATEKDPFAGTAQRLIQQEIPAVIAMQFDFSDEASVCLSETFYAEVSRGNPVDYALAEARKAIHSNQDPEMVEWGTPVLYMRSGDGRLFVLPKRRSRIWYWIGGAGVVAGALGAIALIPGPTTPVHVPTDPVIDLAVRFDTIPSEVEVEQPFTVVGTVSNYGNTEARNIEVLCWSDTRSSDPDAWINIARLDTIHPDTAVTFLLNGYTEAGSYIARLTVDPEGRLDTASTTDNSIERSVIVYADDPPDPKVIDLAVHFDIVPSEVEVEQPFTVVGTVSNYGNTEARNIEVLCWSDTRSSDPDAWINIARLDTIHPDTAVTVLLNGYTEAGSYIARLTVDPEGRLDTEPTDNNSDTRAIDVVAAASVELSVSDFTFIEYTGRTLKALVTVNNTGNVPAESVWVRLWGQEDMGTGNRNYIGSIPAKDSLTSPINVSFTANTGDTYTAEVAVDPENQFADYGDGSANNSAKFTWPPE